VTGLGTITRVRARDALGWVGTAAPRPFDSPALFRAFASPTGVE